MQELGLFGENFFNLYIQRIKKFVFSYRLSYIYFHVYYYVCIIQFKVALQFQMNTREFRAYTLTNCRELTTPLLGDARFPVGSIRRF